MESTTQSLNSIGAFLQNRNRKIFVALDEFQQITSYADQDGEAVIRSWMQSHPSIRFIFSGSHRKLMVSMFSERNRLFYRSTQLLQLGPIGEKHYSRFIGRHFLSNGKRINDQAIKAIFDWCRMQTYCIQLVCNKLYGQYNDIEVEHLQGVFNEIIEQESPLFAGYMKLLTDTQWKVLVAVAHEEPLKNPLAKDFLFNHQLGAASSVSTALKMLKKNEIVIEENGSYYVHDVLLARWLQLI